MCLSPPPPLPVLKAGAGGRKGGGLPMCETLYSDSLNMKTYIYSVVKNKPPRKAVAENLGTLMPICCFSYNYIYGFNYESVDLLYPQVCPRQSSLSTDGCLSFSDVEVFVALRPQKL